MANNYNNNQPPFSFQSQAGESGSAAIATRTQNINDNQAKRAREYMNEITRSNKELLQNDPVAWNYYQRLLQAVEMIRNASGDAARQSAQTAFSDAVQDFSNYAQSQADVQRLMPKNQISAMTAAGVSTTAARQALAGQSSSSLPGGEQPSAQSQTGLSELLNTGSMVAGAISTMSGSAAGIMQMVQSAKRFKIDLQQSQAAADMAKIGVQQGQKYFDCQNSAGEFMSFIDQHKDDESAQGIDSVQGWLDYLKSIQGSDENIAEFLSSNLKNLNHPFGREIANQMLNGNIDNDFYGQQKRFSLYKQKVDIDSTLTNIEKNGAEIVKLFNEIESQSMSNEVQYQDLQISRATFQDRKSSAILLWNDTLASLEHCDKNGVRYHLRSALSDAECAAYVSDLAKIKAHATVSQLARLKELDEGLYRNVIMLGDDYIRNGFESLLDISTHTTEQKIGFGKYAYTESTLSPIVEDICKTLNITHTPKLVSASDLGNRVVNSVGNNSVNNGIRPFPTKTSYNGLP